MKKNTYSKKKFNPMDYKGYMVVLAVLFVILFVLIRIAVGMIYDSNAIGSEVIKQETCLESKKAVNEQTSEDKKNSDSVKETSLKPETKKESKKEMETETIKETKTFPETETKALKESSADINDSLLVLVNRDHPIDDSISYKLVTFETEYQVDERMYEPLTRMLSDAKKEGHELVVCSAWREHELQEKLYINKVDEYLSYGYSKSESEELAAFWVALPGTSEHEIGLAVDIVAKDYQHLNHSQADTEEQQWLMNHCHEYGFILRYPEEKQDITQIGYEPWHYRYVGKTAAAEIVRQKVCLEEYLQSK